MSENTLPVIPANNVMLELTTPLEDGTVPLVNFLENTERFIREHSNILPRVYELEREISKYKDVFREYDYKFDRKLGVSNNPADNENPEKLTTRSIKQYFKPLERCVDKVERTAVERTTVERTTVERPIADLKIEIDELLKENIRVMEAHMMRMRTRKDTEPNDRGEFRQSSEQVSSAM